MYNGYSDDITWCENWECKDMRCHRNPNHIRPFTPPDKLFSFADLKGTDYCRKRSDLLKPENMTDKECRNLWVFSDGEQCISCWKMSFKQRLSALIHGKVWLSVLSGQTQPPVWVDCAKTVFERKDR